MGLVLCLGTPGLIAVLMASGLVPAGSSAPEGLFLQAGYLFTGLVFLSATWVWWRSDQVLRTFKALPECQRPGVILRECLFYAVAFEASSFCGLIYWVLVGQQGLRHACGFLLMTPLLFLALVPRYARWSKAQEK
jgi:hypothetical protein